MPRDLSVPASLDEPMPMTDCLVTPAADGAAVDEALPPLTLDAVRAGGGSGGGDAASRSRSTGDLHNSTNRTAGSIGSPAHAMPAGSTPRVPALDLHLHKRRGRIASVMSASRSQPGSPMTTEMRRRAEARSSPRLSTADARSPQRDNWGDIAPKASSKEAASQTRTVPLAVAASAVPVFAIAFTVFVVVLATLGQLKPAISESHTRLASTGILRASHELQRVLDATKSRFHASLAELSIDDCRVLPSDVAATDGTDAAVACLQKGVDALVRVAHLDPASGGGGDLVFSDGSSVVVRTVPTHTWRTNTTTASALLYNPSQSRVVKQVTLTVNRTSACTVIADDSLFGRISDARAMIDWPSVIASPVSTEWELGQAFVTQQHPDTPQIPLHRTVLDKAGSVLMRATVLIAPTQLNQLLATVTASFTSAMRGTNLFVVDQDLHVLATSLPNVPSLLAAPCVASQGSSSNVLLADPGCLYTTARFPNSQLNSVTSALTSAITEDSFPSSPLVLDTGSTVTTVGPIMIWTAASHAKSRGLFAVGITSSEGFALGYAPQLAIIAGSIIIGIMAGAVAVVLISRFILPLSDLSEKLRRASALEEVDMRDLNCSREGLPAFSEPTEATFAEQQALRAAYENSLLWITACGKYLPDSVLRHIASDCTSPPKVMRKVMGTILHATIDDMATKAAKLSSNQLVEFFAEFSRTAHATVAEHDGVVTSVAGDSITAAWGVVFMVTSHETKAALVALHLARTMPLSASKRSRRSASSEDESLDARCGVCSGEFFCGAIGCGSKAAFSIMGSPVTMAKRLAHLAGSRYMTRILIAHGAATALPPCMVVSLFCAIDVVDDTLPGAPSELPSRRSGPFNSSRRWPNAAPFDSASSESERIPSPRVPEFNAVAAMNDGFLPIYALFGLSMPNVDDKKFFSSRDKLNVAQQGGSRFFLDGVRAEESEVSTAGATTTQHANASRIPRGNGDVLSKLRSTNAASIIGLLTRAATSLARHRVAAAPDRQFAAEITRAVVSYLSGDSKSALQRMEVVAHSVSGVTPCDDSLDSEGSDAERTVDCLPTTKQMLVSVTHGFRLVLLKDIEMRSREVPKGPQQSGRSSLGFPTFPSGDFGQLPPPATPSAAVPLFRPIALSGDLLHRSDAERAEFGDDADDDDHLVGHMSATKDDAEDSIMRVGRDADGAAVSVSPQAFNVTIPPAADGQEA